MALVSLPDSETLCYDAAASSKSLEMIRPSSCKSYTLALGCTRNSSSGLFLWMTVSHGFSVSLETQKDTGDVEQNASYTSTHVKRCNSGSNANRSCRFDTPTQMICYEKIYVIEKQLTE
jgi:hypothetical protein